MRRPNDNVGGPDRSKIEVFYATFEGNAQSIQDLMRALTTAIGRPTSNQSRLIGHGITAAVDAVASPSGGRDDDDSQAPDAVHTVEDDFTSTARAPAARRRRGDGPKTDRNSGLELVADLNFMPPGKPALKRYFADKSPTSDMEQVLVIAHYLQHTLQAKFGPAHVLTAFKHVGEPIPVDLRATIRNMKRGKAWLSFSDLEDIRVTTEGDNVVVHELPHTVNGVGED